MDEQRMTDKVVLVTGAGRGFGTGIAKGFARAGAHVCMVDVNAEELEEARQEIGGNGEIGDDELTAAVADVSDYERMAAVIEQVVAQWGRLDVLVSNAAILPDVSFAETTPDVWNRIIGINLTGVYNGVRAAWEQLVRQGGGHCISIASGASVRGFVNEVAYCTAKHGLEGFTKALAMEGEAHNIAVNTMGPGKLIKPTSLTRASAAALSQEAQTQWVDPVTLAPAFVWLAMQPPARYSGLRFDAGPIADTIAAEGYNFSFAPEKVTMYVDDFHTRLQERNRWTQLEG